MVKSQQKAFLVTVDSDKVHGLDELNIALSRGWQVAGISGMAGASATGDGPRFATLVILERENRESVDVLGQMEETLEESVEDILDGNGSSGEIADDLDDLPPEPQ